MTAARAQPTPLADLLALMDDWPRSWAGFPDDERIGAGLLIPMRSFLTQLAAHGLARATLRRHFHALWVIGGEVIRAVNDDDDLRAFPPEKLLLAAIAHGQAPYVSGATEADQHAFDATARKLFRFLTASAT